MATFATLKRLILRRVDTIAAVTFTGIGPFQVRVSVKPSQGVAFAEVKKHTLEFLNRYGVAGVRYTVIELDENASNETVPPGRAFLRLAAFASDQTRAGLRESLVKAVPSLGRATFQEVPGKFVQVKVAYEDGRSSAKLVNDVRDALTSIGNGGIPFEVSQLPANHPQNELENAGFILPRRDPNVLKITEEDEDTFASRIPRLLTGKTDEVPFIDRHDGTRLLVTPTLRPPVQLACLLPLYDRVFVVMPHCEPDEYDFYFARNFDVSLEDFLSYARKLKIVPVFKFNLGVYPQALIDLWLNDASLPLITPRQLDYIAMRHIWTSSPHLHLLRSDKSVALEVDKFVHHALQSRGVSGPVRGLAQALEWMLLAAEEFEGIAWHRGHLALSNLSSGGILCQTISALPDLFPNKAAAQTVAIDAFGVAGDLATAQAFSASLTEGMLVNQSVLDMILPFFTEAEDVLSQERTSAVVQIVRSLELHHSARIPADEYIEVLDAAETRRIRYLVRMLLEEGHDEIRWLELRNKVNALNQEVDKIERNAVDQSNVDVVGDLTKAGNLTFGMRTIAELLQLSIVRRAGSMILERAVDDTRVGDALDKVRGAINGVSSHAIRVFRIRRKLQSRR